MKRYKLALLLLFPVALYVYIAERNSWRAKTLDIQGRTVNDFFFAPDGRYLIVNHFDDKMKIEVLWYDLSAQRSVKKLADSYGLFFIGPDKLAVGHGEDRSEAQDFHTDVFSLREGALVARSPRHFEACGALPDGKTLLGTCSSNSYGSDLKTVESWDFMAHPSSSHAQSAATPLKHYATLPPLLKSPKSYWPERYITALGDKSVIYIDDYGVIDARGKLDRNITRYWDMLQKKVLFQKSQTVSHEDSNDAIVVMTEDGLDITVKGNQLDIWNIKTGRQQTSLHLQMPPMTRPGKKVTFSCMDLSAADGVLAGASDVSYHIVLCDIKTGKILRLLQGHKAFISALAFSRDGKTLASGSADGVVKLWRVK